MTSRTNPPDPRVFAGTVAFTALAALLSWQSFMPTAYLFETTGPALPVSGTTPADSPVQLVGDAPVYPSKTTLLMTTVSSYGTADESVRGAPAAMSLLDDTKDLFPVRALYPEEVTGEEVREFNAVLMENSQSDAVMAGYAQAGITVDVDLIVAGFSPGSNGEGKIKEGDIVTELSTEEAGTLRPHTYSELRDYLTKVPVGATITVTVDRNGTEKTTSFATIAPPEDDDRGGSLLGILVAMVIKDDSPSADIEIGNIGGPSAGQMFALEIYDQLTEGSLGGDHVIAGTGTIDSLGTVGPIGGIAHKMRGASEAGAEYFLAPVANCDEVIGRIPDDLTVISVATLDDSVHALEEIKAGRGSSLPGCEVTDNAK
ncbi:MAG: S16 family serine protease [Flaviflexus sp.]|nr:S16 family serine protease [Flaviflexus sp.]